MTESVSRLSLFESCAEVKKANIFLQKWPLCCDSGSPFENLQEKAECSDIFFLSTHVESYGLRLFHFHTFRTFDKYLK